MFWSGNYIVVRELNFLLKEENVTLTQVLEADDILQECKADNKALIQFLTKPEVLAELITLITEEPPKNVELAAQYRHANIACEVLTSHLSMLSDRLSMDATQMNRLCDFINRDPPLNPLLASYFSKTVEMLLERSPKQDCYLYHIVCLRVLDFFKSRRDFLPNLLRHMCTSAIADTFKYFIRLDDLFKKTVMEWFEEHQFLECLIQIVCGTYVPEEQLPPESQEKAESEPSEKTEGSEDRKPDTAAADAQVDSSREEEAVSAEEQGRARRAAVASANAAALLCELLAGAAGAAGAGAGGGAAGGVAAALARAATVRGPGVLLGGMFTCGAAARRAALVQGCELLRALLALEAAREPAERTHVELAVAPHLPLLHQALRAPAPPAPPDAVGAARLAVAGLLAALAQSEVEEVASTLLTLGTPAVLLDMFFQYPNNNFLHAHVYTLVKNALNNRVYRTQYARHLLVECDLLTRLMDVFEENQTNKAPRAGYMGHGLQLVSVCARQLAPPELLAHSLRLPPHTHARWAAFLDASLRPLLHQLDTPLGGYYPSENIYEVEIMSDSLAANYDFNDMATAGTLYDLPDDANADDANDMCGAVGSSAESADFIADGLGVDDADKMRAAKSNFLELASQRFDDDMWDDTCEAEAGTDEHEEHDEHDTLAPDAHHAVLDVLHQQNPWETAAAESGGAAGAAPEGWAQFSEDNVAGAQGAQGAHDPFAPPGAGGAPPSAAAAPALPDDEFSPFWSYADTHAHESGLEAGLRALELGDEAASVELANNLLTAMSAMSADAIANIVNANLPEAGEGAAPPS